MKFIELLLLGSMFLVSCTSQTKVSDSGDIQGAGASPIDNEASKDAAQTEDELESIVERRDELSRTDDFVLVSETPLSTFSADVDTASYTRFRETMQKFGQVDQAAIRTEEFLNYFPYQYANPTAEEVFSYNFASTPTPWNEGTRIARIGLKTFEPADLKTRAKNLTFLIDVSGSMSGNKLNLIKESMTQLVGKLAPEDTIAIVTYAGRDEVVLYPTPISQRDMIIAAIQGLDAGGGTNGAAGITTAYKLANDTFVTGGVNRVYLCTDGDFNIGITTSDALGQLVQQESQKGIFLSVFGVGANGGYQDQMLESITGEGNGVYHYIDSETEAAKVLGIDLYKGLVTVAKDTKFQLSFNPDMVFMYRLIGYENRRLNDEDFENDAKDAGDIGAGHELTAIYEVMLNEGVSLSTASAPLFTLSTRFKRPEATESELLSVSFIDDGTDDIIDNPDLSFQIGLVAFTSTLKESQHTVDLDAAVMRSLITQGVSGETDLGLRTEFSKLLDLQK